MLILFFFFFSFIVEVRNIALVVEKKNNHTGVIFLDGRTPVVQIVKQV